MGEVVTNENSAEFYASKMGGDPFVQAEETAKAAEEAEAKAAKDDDDEEKGEEKTAEQIEKEKKALKSQRFQKLANEAKAEKARADAAEARAAALEAKEKERAPKPEPDGEPQPGDFTDAIQYARALAKFEAKKAVEADRAERQADTDRQERQKTLDAFNKRVEEAKSYIPDWEEMVNSATDLKVSDEVRDSVVESDVGPEILYFMATNPEFVQKLGSMSTRKALIEIGKLEAKLEKAEKDDEPEPKPKAEPKTEPKARPIVIQPIRAKSNGVSAADADEVTVPYEEYKAARMKQMART